MLTKVLKVSSIQLEILKTFTPILSIAVEGTVGSTGWKKARLVPYVYVTPPEDGLYEFDLIAIRPAIISLPVETRISTVGKWQDFPPDL